jgi:hypothetical protein
LLLTIQDAFHDRSNCSGCDNSDPLTHTFAIEGSAHRRSHRLVLALTRALSLASPQKPAPLNGEGSEVLHRGLDFGVGLLTVGRGINHLRFGHGSDRLI